MAIGYTWNVSTVDTYPTLDGNADVVYNVHWRLIATDDTNNDADGNAYTSSIYGTCGLDTSSIASFTNFDSLTSSDVQGWVEGTFGADDVTAKKEALDANIALQITPTSVTKTIG